MPVTKYVHDCLHRWRRREVQSLRRSSPKLPMVERFRDLPPYVLLFGATHKVNHNEFREVREKSLRFEKLPSIRNSHFIRPPWPWKFPIGQGSTSHGTRSFCCIASPKNFYIDNPMGSYFFVRMSSFFLHCLIQVVVERNSWNFTDIVTRVKRWMGKANSYFRPQYQQLRRNSFDYSSSKLDWHIDA